MHVRVGHWQNLRRRLRRRLQPPEFKKTERQLLTTSCVQRLNNLQLLDTTCGMRWDVMVVHLLASFKLATPLGR